jgi:hypothetical protein
MPNYRITTAIPNEQQTPTYFLPIKVDQEKFNYPNRARYSNNFHRLRSALMISFIEEFKTSPNNATGGSERIASPLRLQHSFDLINRYIERLTSENTSGIPAITRSKYITEDNLNGLIEEGLVSEAGHPTQKGITTILIFELEWIFKLHGSYIMGESEKISAADSKHASPSAPNMRTTDTITHQLKISLLMYQFCSSRINSTFNPDASELQNRLFLIVRLSKDITKILERSTLPGQLSEQLNKDYNNILTLELVNMLESQLAFLEVNLPQNEMKLTTEQATRLEMQFKFIKTIFESNFIPVLNRKYTKVMQDDTGLMCKALGLVTKIIENLNNKKQHGILSGHASLLIKAYGKILINSLENITSCHLLIMNEQHKNPVIDILYSDLNSETHNKSARLDNEMLFVKTVIDLCMTIGIDIASIQSSISSFIDSDNFIDSILKDNKVSSQTTSGTNPLYTQLYSFYAQSQKKMNDNCGSKNEILSPSIAGTVRIFRKTYRNDNGKRPRSTGPGNA